MAHTYDNKNTIARARNSSGRDITITLGTGATLIVLVVIVDGLTDRTGGNPVYDPTGANVTMTQADQNRYVASTGETIVNMWYTTVSGVTGSKTIHIPDDNNMYFAADVASFISASGTSILVTANGTTGTSTNPTGPTLTGLGPGDVVISVVGSGYGSWGNANLTAQTGTILYNVDDGTWGHGSQYTLTTDSSNQTPGWTESDNEDWAIVAAAFRESRKKFGGTQAVTSGVAGNKYLHGFWKIGGAIVSASSMAAEAIRTIKAFVLKTDQWIASFPVRIFGGAVASTASLAENLLLRRTLTAATVTAVSALSGQQRLLNRFSGAAASVSALLGQGSLLNRFSGVAAAVSGLTGQNNLLNRFSGVVAAISDFSFSNLISRLILGGTAAASAALDAALTFISAAATLVLGGMAAAVSALTGQNILLNRLSGALASISALTGQSRLLNRFSGVLSATSSLSISNLISRLILGGTAAANAVFDAALTFIGVVTVIFGGLIAATSTLSAVVRLIGLFLLKTDQWIAEFVNTYAVGGAFAATSVFSAALEYIGGITTYVVGGTIAAVSYTTARVSLIVQLLIDQWKATFNTLALGGALAVSSSLSAMTILRRVLTAATIAVISAMSAQTVLRRLLTAATVAANSSFSFGVLQRFYRIAGTIVSASAMSVAAIQSMLRMAGSLVTISAMTAQTILRRLLTAATITATSALSLSAVILRQMFAGIVSSASSLLGKLEYVGGIITVLLAGMISAASDISFTSLVERFRMSGNLMATSAFSGAAQLVRVFFGAIASTSSTVFGTLRRTFLISGTIRAVSSFVALAIQGATAVIVTVHRLIRPIALLMGRSSGDKRNKL